MARAQVYAPAAGVRGGELPEDDYFAKLVKYIPGEVLAFFAPISAFIGAKDTKILVISIVGGIGTIGWLYASGRKVPADQRPRSYTYVLAVLAFAAWAIGISVGVRHMLWSLSDDWAGIILAASAFLIPMADIVLSDWWARRAHHG